MRRVSCEPAVLRRGPVRRHCQRQRQHLSQGQMRTYRADERGTLGTATRLDFMEVVHRRISLFVVQDTIKGLVKGFAQIPQTQKGISQNRVAVDARGVGCCRTASGFAGQSLGTSSFKKATC
jgi:hypothetical protein